MQVQSWRNIVKKCSWVMWRQRRSCVFEVSCAINKKSYPAPSVSPTFSVMKTPPSATRACTSACPAVKRTSTAAPTCRQTSPSRGAPKKPSGSPPSSAPPNSHKTVVYHCSRSPLLHMYPWRDVSFHWILSFGCVLNQWTSWLSWTGRPIQTGFWTFSEGYGR